MKHPFHDLLALGCLLSLSACSPQKAALEPATQDSYFPISINGTIAHLQLALTPAEQQKGLMHRDSLDANNGMLFLFPNVGPHAIWMRNTRIPLDLAYFDSAGKLLELHTLYPYDETSVPSRSQHVLIAVETNRGWFAQNNIRPGARLDLEALRSALKQRGKSPSAYQLQITP